MKQRTCDGVYGTCFVKSSRPILALGQDFHGSVLLMFSDFYKNIWHYLLQFLTKNFFLGKRLNVFLLNSPFWYAEPVALFKSLIQYKSSLVRCFKSSAAYW